MKIPRTFPLALCLATGLAQIACGPLGPIPGGALRGEVAAEPPASWVEFADVEQIQLETRPSDPYSVNVWCGVYDGNLYVPTSLILGVDDPMERQWVQNVMADPEVRVRIRDTVHPLRAVKVEDADELTAVRMVLLAKYELEVDPHIAEGFVFRLEPR